MGEFNWEWLRAVVVNRIEYAIRVVPQMAAYDAANLTIVVTVSVLAAYWLIRKVRARSTRGPS